VPGPAGEAYSVSPNPVPGLRRKGRANDKGKRKEKRKGKRRR